MFRDRTCDPFAEAERLSVAEAFAVHAGVDLMASILADGSTDAGVLGAELDRIGVRRAGDDTWSDMLSRVLSEKVEPKLGDGRVTILDRYPSAEALAGLSGIDPAFKAIPRDPLPFPSIFVASSNDPFSTMEQSADLSLAWGSDLVEAGDAGHINAASGHGPWPEGLMRFAGFLSKLK